MFQHIVLTRFNVRQNPTDPNSAPSDQWLENRFKLFETYTLSSMKTQTNKRFKWFIYFDLNTPDFFKNKVNTYVSEFPNIIPFYVDEILPYLREHILQHTDPNATHLISTRLDNDDALHYTFIEQIQASFSGQHKHFINFTHGYSLINTQLFTNPKPSNPFISFIEQLTDFTSVWCGVEHTEYHRVGFINEIDTYPMWLQVIHGENLANKVHPKGLRMPLHNLEGQFEFYSMMDNPDGLFLNVSYTGEDYEGYTSLLENEIYSLDKESWLFDDASIELIRFQYTFETLGSSNTEFVFLLKELYRCMKDRGEVHILATHPNHSNFLKSPLSARAIVPELLQKLNTQNVFGRLHKVHFQVEAFNYNIDPAWVKKIESGEIQKEAVAQLSNLYLNVFESSYTRMRVIKH